MGKGADRFDGVAVDYYEGRFQGAFPIEESLGAELSYDDVVGFFVVGSLSKANVAATASGDVKRTNYFVPTSAIILDAKMAQDLALELGVSEAVSDPETGVQTSIYDHLEGDDERF